MSPIFIIFVYHNIVNDSSEIKYDYMQTTKNVFENQIQGLQAVGYHFITYEDLKALMFVFYNKEELKKNVTTEKKLSALIYKNQNSKYLSNKLSVKNAVLKIFG